MTHRFFPHLCILYTTKHTNTQCQGIFKQTSLRCQMHTDGTVFSRAGAEGASTDFGKPWIICHFPRSVTERPLCSPPPASFPPPFYTPFHDCHGSSIKKIGNCFPFPTPPCCSYVETQLHVCSVLNQREGPTPAPSSPSS